MIESNEDSPFKTQSLARHKADLDACEKILARQARAERKAMAKKVSIGLFALGAIATVGYVAMSMKSKQ